MLGVGEEANKITMTQRTIKFRAWSEGRMYCNFGLTDSVVEDYRLYYDTDQGLLKTARFNDEDFILMQFTGLLDKNGKEIYEGDLIRFIDPETDDERVSKVVYSNMGCFTYDGQCYYDFIVDWDEVEVIGNSFENPELLK